MASDLDGVHDGDSPTNGAAPERAKAEDATAGHATLFERLAALVDEVYWPSAERFDRFDTVGIDRFEPIADLGLFGSVVPADAGGLHLAPRQVRKALRMLSSGCGTTAFMFAQHHGAAAAVAATSNEALRERWLGRLVDRTLAGTAYAHVRRARQPVIEAAPDGAGRWRLTGEAPWATSWGVASVYTVAAVSPRGDLVWGLFEPGDVGVSAPAPLDLMVFGRSGTVRLRFDDAIVDESNLLSVLPLERWRERDQHLVARPSPLALGVGDRAFALLAEAAPETAAVHRDRWLEVSEQAAHAAASVDEGTSVVEEVAAARADVVLTVQMLTTALLSVLGGRAAELSEPAQRLAREALFYVVQGQADNGRMALLKALDSSG